MAVILKAFWVAEGSIDYGKIKLRLSNRSFLEPAPYIFNITRNSKEHEVQHGNQSKKKNQKTTNKLNKWACVKTDCSVEEHFYK